MVIILKSEKTPRLKAAGVFLFCGLLLAGLSGCSVSRHGDTAFSVELPLTTEDENPSPYPLPLGERNKVPPSSYVRDVPFFPGEEYQCGPSVLASALNYLGYDIRPEDISGEIYLRNVKGTLNIDMVSFAGRFEDITVTELQGDITLLRENLSMGYPLIVFVDLGIWSIRKGHYMLVVGYDDSREVVIVYSGAEKDKLIRYEDFMRIWRRGSFWTLRITKK